MGAASFSWHPSSLEEDGHFFDFIAFYKRMEFCDRSIRLEILEECRRVQGPACEDDAMTEAPDEQNSKTPGLILDERTQENAGNDLAGTAGGREEQPEKEADGFTCSSEKSAGQNVGENAEKNSPDEENEPPDTSDRVQRETYENMEEVRQENRENAETKADSETKAESGEIEKNEYVEDVPVNSIVLAAKSCVLRTMLSNGMKESEKSAPVVLKVTPEEKEDFKEMLHFMYAGSLSERFEDPETKPRLLLDLLLVGDKFQVGSFMGAVLKALSKRKQSVSDSIVLGLEIPEALEQHPQIKELVSKGKGHLLETFKDAEKWDTSLDFLTLKQEVVSFLLQSEGLEAASEEKVFAGIVTWAQNNHDKMEERQRAMLGLSKHIRFGCMRGEILKNALSMEELALPECRERVMQGIYFQAYSDDMKLKLMDVACRERKAIQSGSFEILFNFKLDEAGTALEAPPAEWLDKLWVLELQKEKQEGKPSTVGAYLTPKQKEPEAAFASIKVFYSYYVRKWPSGYWCRLGKTDHNFELPLGYGYGYVDIFKAPWDEVRKSKEFVGVTGEITMKVIVQRV